MCEIRDLSYESDKSGFIQSPNYPEYYGNFRDCLMYIQIPDNMRLNLYLVTLNIEGQGLFGNINDYIEVNGNQKYYDLLQYPIEMKNFYDREEIISLKFVTDFVTTKILSKPKGFLIFYECKSSKKS
jgi:hypothetical protein